MIRWLGALALFLVSPILFASEPDAASRHAALEAEMARLRAEQGPYRMRLFEEKSAKALQGQPASVRKQRSRYRELKKEMEFWGYASGLRNDLIENFRAAGRVPEREAPALEAEANRLAIALIRAIGELKDRYNIHTFPIVHNLLIQTGLSKRGACKHWAEDLLAVVNRVERKYFVGFWAEAHPGSVREHNVAALVPAGAPFEAGLLIDPWRTAGKPYWSPIKKDHYPWQAWPGYDPR